MDAGNGMAGLTVPVVFDGLPIDLVPMFFELDGSFPNHEANPLDPKNLVDLQQTLRSLRAAGQGADIGLAFDGDADRCFVVDENGDPVSPSAITALVAERELARKPGATILYNLISSATVPQVIAEHGGVAVRTRVGHSFIKAEMARTGAVFGGEHSAHYYFEDFYRADTGMLAALHVLAALGAADPADTPLSGAGRRLRPVHRVRRDQLHGRRRAGQGRRRSAPGRRPTAPPSTSWTGSPSPGRTATGSTCARRTPNRCCGSTSRRPLAERMAALRDELLALIRG